MPRHGISRQLQPSSSGSTPHDRVSSPQICLSRSLPLDWPRQSALRFPADISNRPTVHDVRRDPPLIHEPLHRRTTCWIGSTPITHLARDSQISIAPAARFYVPPARFPPLEAFGRRPPNTRRRPSSGRHPKPFTEVAVHYRVLCGDRASRLQDRSARRRSARVPRLPARAAGEAAPRCEIAYRAAKSLTSAPPGVKSLIGVQNSSLRRPRV